MKDALQRILFYLRYEMTEDVRTRIELSVQLCFLPFQIMLVQCQYIFGLSFVRGLFPFFVRHLAQVRLRTFI